MTGEEANPRNKAEPVDPGGISRIFGDVANKISEGAGRASVFVFAAGIVIVWGITGPLFRYSDTCVIPEYEWTANRRDRN